MRSLQVLGIVLVIVGIIGAYQFPKQELFSGTASPAGSSFLTAKAAGQQLSISSSTILSLQNTDAADRTITSVNFSLTTGATSTSYVVACATSSTQFWPSSANSNVILQQALSGIGSGTTTGSGLFFASTSPGVTGIAAGAASTTARLWPTGSYMVCKETSTPSNDLLPASSDGIISFPYFTH